MADSITLTMDDGRADKTGLDPDNSGSADANGASRFYVTGPPTDGQPRGIGWWSIQAFGTQTDSNSVTGGTYAFMGNYPHYTIAPTVYEYVALW